MAFNGAGIFNRLYSWVTDAANGIKIRADRMDNEMNGMATGLTDCVTRDGQSPALAVLPMGGFNHINVADATAANEYASLGQVQSNASSFAVGAGTAQAITANFTPTFTAGQLKDGTLLTVRALLANTATAPTFSPDGVTAEPIVKLGGKPLVAGDIFAPLHDMELCYDLAHTRWELLNPAKPYDAVGQTINIGGGAVGGYISLLIQGTASGYYSNSLGEPNDRSWQSMANQINSGGFASIIYGNGDMLNQNGIYGAISDRKLKQDEVIAGSQWEDIKAIGKIVKKYHLISNPTGPLQLGLVAQDLQPISPGLVVAVDDFRMVENEESGVMRELLGTQTLTVNYSVLYMKAVKALAEALERIETLERKANV